MSLRDGVWKLWRDAPGFSQRFTGTFNADGNTITGSIESSRDGAHWEHDFDLTYSRAAGAEGYHLYIRPRLVVASRRTHLNSYRPSVGSTARH
jgi:hypothetical protein